MKNLLTPLQFINESEESEDYPKLFTELSKEEQAEAIEKNAYILVEYDEWFEDVIDLFKEDMEELGISDIEVSFTGFHSQGDGASFTSNRIDTKEFMTKALNMQSTTLLDLGDDTKKKNDLTDLVDDLRELGFKYDKMEADDLYFSFDRTSSHYSHENTVTASLELTDYPDDWEIETENIADKFFKEVEEKAEDWRKDQSKELYDLLNKEYDSLTSEEVVKDMLISNEYEFKSDGTID